MLKYRGYEAKIDFDEVDKVFHGKVLHISDYILFEASHADEVEANFHQAIEDYLKGCEEQGKEPNDPVGKIMSFSQIPMMIERIQGRIKHIPQDQIQALETVHMMLEVLNCYAFWVEGLKKELTKLDGLNKKQAEALRNRGLVNV